MTQSSDIAIVGPPTRNSTKRSRPMPVRVKRPWSSVVMGGKKVIGAIFRRIAPSVMTFTWSSAAFNFANQTSSDSVAAA
jgi:hypothetical protein